MADEWEAADGETFEKVVFSAAKKLGVEITTTRQTGGMHKG